MSILRKIEPRKRAIDVRRTTPLTHSMEEFFENFPPRRWMETISSEDPGGERHTVKVA